MLIYSIGVKIKDGISLSLTIKCVENNKSKFEEFCISLIYPKCYISNILRASCRGIKWPSPFELSEKYFKDLNKADADPLTDYCPIENKINKDYYVGLSRQGSSQI